MELAAGAGDMLVQAEKSDLRLSGAPVAGHRYSLSTQNGEIQVPEQLGLVFGQNRQTAWSESNRAAHRIDLRTTFGKIVIGFFPILRHGQKIKTLIIWINVAQYS